jgi:hypothetical protein
MSNLKKILLSCFLIFIIGVTGLFYYVSTKISPEELRLTLQQEVQKAIPNSIVDLGPIEYSLGANIKFQLTRLDIKSKNKLKNDLFKVKGVEIKIPIWSIITGGGDIDVLVNKPQIYYKQFKKTDNWSIALKKKSSKSKKVKSKKAPEAEKNKKGDLKEKTDGQITLPVFLTKSKLNLKLLNIQVDYLLKNKDKGKLDVSKFILKDIGLNHQTAFVIDSDLSFKNKTNKISLHTLIIGEFNVSDILSKPEFKTTIEIKVGKIKMSDFSAYELPAINTKLNVMINKKGHVAGDASTNFLDRNVMDFNFSVNGDNVLVSKVKTLLFIQDLAKIINLQLVGIDYSATKLALDGDLSIKKGVLRPALSLKLSPAIKVSLGGLKAQGEVSGTLKAKKLSLNLKNKIFDGPVNVSLDTNIDINNPPNGPSKMSPIVVSIDGNGIQVPKDYIREALYGKSAQSPKAKTAKNSEPKEEKSTTPVGSSKTSAPAKVKESPVLLPPLRLGLNLKGINIGGEDLAINGKVIVAGNSIATKKVKFKYSRGSGSLNHTTKITNLKSVNKFDFSMTDLNLSSLKVFLPPMLESVSGFFSGSASGEATLPNIGTPKYNVIIDTKAINGELKGLNISEHVNGLVSKLTILKGKVDANKKYDVDGNFERLIFKGNLKTYEHQIKTFDFVGVDKKIEINGSGKIVMLPQKNRSEMKINFKDNTGSVSKTLKKEAGTEILPLRLKGTGYELVVDYPYTIKKLAKSAYKTKGKAKIKKIVNKKLKKKLGKKAESLADKLLKGKGKKKINKLLDGLFK